MDQNPKKPGQRSHLTLVPAPVEQSVSDEPAKKPKSRLAMQLTALADSLDQDIDAILRS